MQINTKNIENKIIEFQTGNQTKARVDGTWYKADYLGYEGAAEYVASSILKYSNIKNYVNYDLCNISYMKEGEINISMGCKSDDFMKNYPEGSEFVPLDEFFELELDIDIVEMLEDMSTEDAIKSVVGMIEGITGKEDVGAYITSILEFDTLIMNDDTLIMNEDRHFSNIGLIKTPDGTYEYAPIFDNGASFLSDMQVDYPINKDTWGLINSVTFKPFDLNCDKQLDICHKLYGQQLNIKNMPGNLIDEDVINKVRATYGEKIANRIEYVFDHQRQLYGEYFNNKEMENHQILENDKNIIENKNIEKEDNYEYEI